VICDWLFSVWSTKWSLGAHDRRMVLGMLGWDGAGIGAGGLSRPVIPWQLLILGSTGVISMLCRKRQRTYRCASAARHRWVAA